MSHAEAAHLMARAVLDGDMVAARQLADWLAEHAIMAPPRLDPKTRLYDVPGLSRRFRGSIAFAVVWARTPGGYARMVSPQRVYAVTLADLAALPVEEFRFAPGVGKATLAAARAVLARHGLHLKGDVPLTE